MGLKGILILILIYIYIYIFYYMKKRVTVPVANHIVPTLKTKIAYNICCKVQLILITLIKGGGE